MVLKVSAETNKRVIRKCGYNNRVCRKQLLSKIIIVLLVKVWNKLYIKYNKLRAIN